MHDADRDLPEGVINADPAGGWQDGQTADRETEERSEDAADTLASDGWVADIPQAANAAGTRRSDGGGTDVGTVESDALTQGADPDLATDEVAADRTTQEK